MPKPYLSIVIPTFNEATRLPKTLEQIQTYLQSQTYSAEVIVVDDGSSDTTCAIVKAKLDQFPQLRLLENKINQGKGAVVRQGMLRAAGEFRLFTDADLSTPITEVEKLFAGLVSGEQVAVGSRALKMSEITVHQPFYREVAGKLFNFMVKRLYLPQIHDSQCGFKLFTAHAAETIFNQQVLNSIVFDVELLYIARQAGLGLVEIPIHWENSLDSRIVPSMANAVLVWKDLFRIGRVHKSLRPA